MSRFWIVLAAIASLGAPAAAHAGCTTIDAIPATISAPGQYCLAKDFTVNATAGSSIEIAANGVTLDCGGHSLSNLSVSSTGTADAIRLANRNGIVIKNCRIFGGYRSGIYAAQNNTLGNKNYYILIEDNYIAGPLRQGILAFGSAIEIRGNHIYDIGGQKDSGAFGIYLSASNLAGAFRFHVVKDNLVAGTNSPYFSANGIFSERSLGGIFTGNEVIGTSARNPSYGAYGIRVSGTGNRITGNHVTGGGDPEGDFGIYTPDGSSNRCFDNYISARTATTGCDAQLGNY